MKVLTKITLLHRWVSAWLCSELPRFLIPQTNASNNAFGLAKNNHTSMIGKFPVDIDSAKKR